MATPKEYKRISVTTKPTPKSASNEDKTKADEIVGKFIQHFKSAHS